MARSCVPEDMRFITAFNRDRDGYQVPLALYEGGMLERLVTDLYVPDLLCDSAFAKRLGVAHRRVEGLPSGKVAMTWHTVWMQVVGRRFCRNEADELALFTALDRKLSRKSLRIARNTGASFFTYSSYALEAFRDPAMRSRRKVLFVYHPPSFGFMEILQRDLENHPEMSWSYALHQAEMANADGQRLDEEISLADEVVCASTFTKRAIRKINAEIPITVIPYGCDAPSVGRDLKPSAKDGRPRVLFVGQGVQRKGVHHLLKAWNCRDRNDADLVLVCSKLDPAIKSMIAEPTASVRVVAGLDQNDLNRAFAEADVFVMPSLAEGFGLVFLEALSAGCYCIGTPHTGLPDLNLPEKAGRVVPCGDIEALQNALDDAIEMAANGCLNADFIRHEAGQRSWKKFREGIRAVATGIRHLSPDGGGMHHYGCKVFRQQ